MDVRCYVQKTSDNLWVAQSVEFGLAAQSTRLNVVQQKLRDQVFSYVAEANGIDSQYREQLLTRKSPMCKRFKYRLIKWGIICNAFTCTLDVDV